jgi:O-antigen ligase
MLCQATKMKYLKINYIRELWKLAFFTFPLVGIRHLRIGIGPLQPPIFFIILVGIVIFLVLFKDHKIILNNNQKGFILAFFLLLLVYTFNTFRSLDTMMAISQVIRLAMAFFSFVAIVTFFPKDHDTLKKILNVVIIASTILMLAYIYRYLIMFKSLFLSIDWNEKTQSGRNQLGIYLAVVTPIVLWKYIFSGLFSVWAIPTIIHVASIFYSMNRSAWVSLSVSLVIIAIILTIKKASNYKKIAFRALLGVCIIIILFSLFYFDKKITFSRDFQSRVQTLVPADNNEEDHSIYMRKEYLDTGITRFIENPLLGIGTSNLFIELSNPPHNDYVEIMAEQGSLGIILFLFMMFLVIKECFVLKNESWSTIGLKHSSLAIIFYMPFTDAHKTVMIYVIFALLLSLRDQKEKIQDIIGNGLKTGSIIKLTTVSKNENFTHRSS